MKFNFNDGGRQAAGYKGHAGDCVARAIAIASGKPYQEIYDALAAGTGNQRQSKHTKAKGATANRGINVRRKWFKEYMISLGFTWTPTMLIGQGCKVHLKDGELPMGRLVVAVSKHYTAVIDGEINDTHNPQRKVHWFKPDGTLDRVSERCVYGYWKANDKKPRRRV